MFDDTSNNLSPLSYEMSECSHAAKNSASDLEKLAGPRMRWVPIPSLSTKSLQFLLSGNLDAGKLALNWTIAALNLSFPACMAELTMPISRAGSVWGAGRRGGGGGEPASVEARLEGDHHLNSE